MHQAGYDVKQSVRLWELMDAQSKGQRPPEFMSTHPNDATRLKELEQFLPEARKYSLRTLAAPSPPPPGPHVATPPPPAPGAPAAGQWIPAPR